MTNKPTKRASAPDDQRILAPDLLAVFPDSESVNEALHTFVRIASAAIPQRISANTATAPKPKKKKAHS
ncbi:MAG: hypothetical protein ACRD3J_07630 [Thermoanaerobaculia bacterium]